MESLTFVTFENSALDRMCAHLMLFFSNGNQEQELQVWLVSVMKFTEFNSVMYDISQTVKCNMITVKWKPNTDDFTLMLWDRENKRNKYSKSKLF